MTHPRHANILRFVSSIIVFGLCVNHRFKEVDLVQNNPTSAYKPTKRLKAKRTNDPAIRMTSK